MSLVEPLTPEQLAQQVMALNTPNPAALQTQPAVAPADSLNNGPIAPQSVLTDPAYKTTQAQLDAGPPKGALKPMGLSADSLASYFQSQGASGQAIWHSK